MIVRNGRPHRVLDAVDAFGVAAHRLDFEVDLTVGQESQVFETLGPSKQTGTDCARTPWGPSPQEPPPYELKIDKARDRDWVRREAQHLQSGLLSARNWCFLAFACVWVCSIQAADPGSSSYEDPSATSGAGHVLQCEALGGLSGTNTVQGRIPQCSKDALTSESSSSKQEQAQIKVCYQFQIPQKSQVSIDVDGWISSVSLHEGTVSVESVLEEGDEIVASLAPQTYFIVGEIPRCATKKLEAVYQVRIQMEERDWRDYALAGGRLVLRGAMWYVLGLLALLGFMALAFYDLGGR